eukprot:scaffold180499_cov31-Tisochrysis_lutea.AAC.1
MSGVRRQGLYTSEEIESDENLRDTLDEFEREIKKDIQYSLNRLEKVGGKVQLIKRLLQQHGSTDDSDRAIDEFSKYIEGVHDERVDEILEELQRIEERVEKEKAMQKEKVMALINELKRIKINKTPSSQKPRQTPKQQNGVKQS